MEIGKVLYVLFFHEWYHFILYFIYPVAIYQLYQCLCIKVASNKAFRVLILSWAWPDLQTSLDPINCVPGLPRSTFWAAPPRWHKTCFGTAQNRVERVQLCLEIRCSSTEREPPFLKDPIDVPHTSFWTSQDISSLESEMCENLDIY